MLQFFSGNDDRVPLRITLLENFLPEKNADHDGVQENDEESEGENMAESGSDDDLLKDE